jgi:glucosylceramidase
MTRTPQRRRAVGTTAALAYAVGTTAALACAVGLSLLALLVAAAPPAIARAAADPRVAVYLTTADGTATLARRQDLAFHSGTPTGPDQISVDPGSTGQTLTAGFGLAMTDTSAYELDDQLPASIRNAVMRRLFSPTGGIGLSFLRIPIGGSDYIVGQPYTYDDMPSGATDPTLAHFSIAHDDAYILPMTRRALALNPAMTVMANPWTPPAWMKTDDTLITRTGPLGTLKPEYYGVYASYLVKFLQAYQAAGVHVNYLGVQNEPLTPDLLVAGIPESYLSAQDERTLIDEDVAPALRAAGLPQKILAFDDTFGNAASYIPGVMQGAGADVGGLAFHCYLSDASAMSAIHAQYPQQPLLETECSSDLSNLSPAQMAIRSLRNWAQGVQLWNVALDQQHGPKIGNGCQGLTPPHLGTPCTAPVIVNTTTHTYSLTSDYWQLGQFSSFIHLGATRIASNTPSTCRTSLTTGYDCGLEDVAFRNRDGSQVMVATTNDGAPHTATVTEAGRSFSYTVPDGATVTFVWPAPTPNVTRLRTPTRVRPHRALHATFTIAEGARVTATITRLIPHHRHRTIAVERVSAAMGANRIAFAGRRTRRRLVPGAYRLAVTAVDAGGERSARVTVRFVAA